MTFESFKEKYQKTPVVHYATKVDYKPLVSVCIQTYNHYSYIQDCLEGVLKQKTNFDYEILLGEDQSEDGTREICIEYATKYPEKIRLFLHHRENNIKINGSPSGRFNSLYNKYQSKGKYIALCEGDDYWIDEYKLQKQINLINENKEIDLIYTDVHILNEKTDNLIESVFKNDLMPIIKDAETAIYNAGFMAPCTWLYRKKILENIDNPAEYPDASFAMMIEAFRKKGVEFMSDTTATYRKLEESASHSKSREKMYKREKGILKTQLEYIDKLSLPNEFRNKVLTRHYKIILPSAIALNKKKEINKAFEHIKPDKRSLRDRILLYISKSPFSKYFLRILYALKSVKS